MMSQDVTEHPTDKATPERLLACEVILAAIADAKRGDPDSISFLTAEPHTGWGKSLAMWCAIAGVNPVVVREKIGPTLPKQKTPMPKVSFERTYDPEPVDEPLTEKEREVLQALPNEPFRPGSLTIPTYRWNTTRLNLLAKGAITYDAKTKEYARCSDSTLSTAA